MRRRDFIKLMGTAAAARSFPASAQQVSQPRRIGVLSGVSWDDPEFRQRIDALRQGLRDQGWADADIALELRFAEGKLDRLPGLAAELVNARVNVIVTSGTEVAVAAHNATKTIPIVMATIGDAVGAGLVATEQGGKRLELIRQVVPNLRRVAAFSNPNNASHRVPLKELQLAAPKLGLQLESIPIGSAGELEPAFNAAVHADAQVIVTLEDALIIFLRERIIELAMRHKLPVMGEFSAMCHAGALMSYAPDLRDLWRSAARYVDKILKGANPADLPIEQPTKFQLVLNLKTAKALGLAMPQALLVTADEVID